jgi:poly(3-hydroxybutyrate) depolymerase
MFKSFLTALAIAFALQPALAAGDIAKETIAFGGRDRTYYLYVPAAPAPVPMPMIVLLHGTGGNGLYMAQMWEDVATREGIALLAPDSLHSGAGWDLRVDGPDYIRAVLAQVGAAHAIDSQRVYLFGQSGGAVYALQLGMLESEFFAAVAVHAGSWRHPDEYEAMRYAKRKIPVSISIGDKDEYFSMESVQNTQRVLTDGGFPITVNILKDRVHRYSDVPANFNAGVWTFLRGHVLPGDPKYADYYYQAPLR